MNRTIACAFIVASIRAYTQSLADCESFAAEWDNTCSDGAITGSTILDSTDVTSLTCTGDATWCVGTTEDDDTYTSCSHDYFTCVTCSEVNSVVYIRV